MLAVSLAFPMAAQAKAWDFENGSYVDASGTPIEGAVAKGITVTKYQNRANRENGIDWGKVAADGVGFAMIPQPDFPWICWHSIPLVQRAPICRLY